MPGPIKLIVTQDKTGNKLDNSSIEAAQESLDSRDKDAFWMAQALKLAQRSRDQGEVPVGAVLVKDDEILGEGWNQPITHHDPTAHAEVMAIRAAGRSTGNYRLPGTTLYVTLEPCTMCVGAMVHARVERLVFGTPDPRTGSVVSVARLLEAEHHNHRVEASGGILQEECGRILRDFFRERRKSPQG